ncbi:MAG: NifU family protein [Nocardioidaceae bacterium]|nr:NifU family protein [Nocardioidaceae bacterium]
MGEEPVRQQTLAEPPDVSLAALGPLIDRLEGLLADIEALDEHVRDRVFELLDGVDAVHRLAVIRLADALGADLRLLRRSDPAVDWLFEAYGVGVDDVVAASAALERVRPYLHEHGGEVEVLSVQHGVVRVHLLGACSGCTAAAETLRHGVEEALRENLPGFVAMAVQPDEKAAPHPPPGQVLLQITPRPT